MSEAVSTLSLESHFGLVNFNSVICHVLSCVLFLHCRIWMTTVCTLSVLNWNQLWCIGSNEKDFFLWALKTTECIFPCGVMKAWRKALNCKVFISMVKWQIKITQQITYREHLWEICSPKLGAHKCYLCP